MEVGKVTVHHNLLDQCPGFHQSVARNMEQDPDMDFQETKLKNMTRERSRTCIEQVRPGILAT